MAANAGAPIIIKRKKIVVEDGHHGGAWKVAYADFVTAMMAFFMLMWLLNATTEKQRKGIADYFNPTIPVTRVSGGGDGALGGDSVFTEDSLAQSGTGGLDSKAPASAEQALFEEIDESLTALAGESMLSTEIARHIVTRVTDRGLVVELFDTPEQSLFDDASATPNPLLQRLVEVVSEVFELASNPLEIGVHTKAEPIVHRVPQGWALSSERAMVIRDLIERSGTSADRIARLQANADRSPATDPPIAERNSRIELVLLRMNF